MFGTDADKGSMLLRVPKRHVTPQHLDATLFPALLYAKMFASTVLTGNASSSWKRENNTFSELSGIRAALQMFRLNSGAAPESMSGVSALLKETCFTVLQSVQEETTQRKAEAITTFYSRIP